MVPEPRTDIIKESNPETSITLEAPITPRETPVGWLDLPNKPQLFILALCRLSEPLSNVCLLPYIFYLVRSVLRGSGDGEGAPNSDDISFYSGLLVASFPLAQFVISLPWGWISDRHGRKPSIVAGLFVSVVANAAFGFSQSLAWLFVWRSVAGIANGNVGLMRTMTAEIVRERRFQTKAFLLLPLVFNSGMVLSLALGGILAEPVTNLPWLFGPKGCLNWGHSEEGVVWLTKYPFALPALMNAFVLGIALILAVLGLNETLPGKEHQNDPGIVVGRRVLGGIKRTVSRCRGTRFDYTPLQDTEHLAEAEEPIQLQEIKSPDANTTTPVAKGPRLPFRKIWTRRTLTAMVSFGLFPLHNSAFMHILPVYLSTPHDDASSRPFASLSFTGGLGLNSRTIGLWLSFFGICGILLQLFVYPRMQASLCTLGVFKVSLLIFPLVYAFAPFLSIIPGHSIASWIALGCVVWGQIMARTMYVVNSFPTRGFPHSPLDCPLFSLINWSYEYRYLQCIC